MLRTVSDGDGHGDAVSRGDIPTSAGPATTLACGGDGGRPSKTKKRRAKTFTGCWTCRRRHVKCDERRPGCDRCQRARLDCEGYGVLLTWTTPEQGWEDDVSLLSTSNQSHSSRRTQTVDKSSVQLPLYASGRIRRILDDLDDAAELRQSTQIACFSVFPGRRCSDTDELQSTTSVDNGSRDVSSSSNAVALDTMHHDVAMGGVYVDSEGSSTPVVDTNSSCDEVCEPSVGSGDHGFSHHISTRSSVGPSDHPHHALGSEINHMNNQTMSSDLDQQGETISLKGALAAESEEASQAQSDVDFSTTLVRANLNPRPDSGHQEETCISDDLPASEEARTSSTSSDVLQTATVATSNTDHLLSLEKPWRPPQEEPSVLRHIDLLLVPKNQLELIHHWNSVLSSKLLPVDRLDNPCRTMIVPLAMAGICSSSAKSSGQVALFHAMCSCAAYNLAALQQEPSNQYDVLGLKHELLALNHLRHSFSISQPLHTTPEEGMSLLITILLCTTAEAISGTPERWKAHLSGGLLYFEQLVTADLCLTGELSALLQDYIYLAAQCNLAVPKKLLRLFSNMDAGGGHLVRAYGVTRQALLQVVNINALIASTIILDCNQLDLIELQLVLSLPARPKDREIDEEMADFLHCLGTIFHFATLIYFKRRVRQCDSNAVQALVEKAVAHIEASEVYMGRAGGSMSMWPCVVIGSECQAPELQDRMLKWFGQNERHGFKNINAIRNSVVSIWEQRSLTEPDHDAYWLSASGESVFAVFPL